ncbi:hypothetical protein TKK_0013582 [Trichogramma kaykai]
MMESKEDTVRVKEEPKNTWLDAGEDYTFDSVDSCKVKNFGTFTSHEQLSKHMHKTMALQDRLDKEIFIDVECKNIKPELTSLTTKICKNEYQDDPPIVKIENLIQTSSLVEKSTMILIKKDFDCDKKRKCQENFRLQLDKAEKIFETGTVNQLSNENKMRRKTYTGKNTLNKHINVVHNWIKLFECDVCHKSLGKKGNLTTHISTIHNRSKSFECEICHKSFGLKHNLEVHISTVHNQNKPFACDICHKLFGQKGNIKTHINAVHNRSKPFECDICQTSYAEKGNLTKHLNAIHNRSKTFECDICHKSFGHKCHLQRHENAVHKCIKPFECKICYKSYSLKHQLKRHLMTVHNCSKSLEYEIRP